VACTVLDVSSAGACLRLDAPGPQTTALRLIVGTVAPISAVSTWRKGALLGVRFLHEQQWVQGSYRERFDPAHWLND
jgi:hypothetical protein